MKKVVIGSMERGFVYQDKQFARILSPGVYWFLNPFAATRVETFDITNSLELPQAQSALVATRFDAEVDRFLFRVAPTNREIAVVFRNARAIRFVSPGQEKFFWRGAGELSVRTFDISTGYELDRETVRDLDSLMESELILTIRVPEQSRALLFDASVLVRELGPGNYSFWRSQRELRAIVTDMRLTPLDVSGQEMLTKDKVTVRLNLSMNYRIVDPAQAVRSVTDVQAEIYRVAQLSLRQVVGEKTLDELLENKDLLNSALESQIAASVSEFGTSVSRVGVKDVILPGDMRALFNQVVEAEKAAQAQNIRRREEVAATRSLLNTARMLENNPTLMRLKELEAAERISEKIEKLTVYDGLKGVINGVVKVSE